MSQRPVGPVEQLNSLSHLQLSAETLDSVMGHITRVGLETLEGWDAAAASLVEKDKFATYGTQDERINPVDQAQYDAKKGPCVDAAKTGKFKYFDGTVVPPEWRMFAEAAAAADVYSVMSFPMMLDDETLGALNFYSRERGALREGQHEEGMAFASHAAVTIANMRHFASKGVQVEQLEEGLQTRTMIGQATGLLMAQEGLTSDEAFQKLVRVSQNANIKLREIAQRYVQAWEEKASGASSPPPTH